MQLNELIEKEGLENLSQKTNISTDNLKHLENGNFEKLNRVKSLGFVNIIERDYDVELSELRDQIKEYFDDHHSAKDDEVVMLSPDRVEESGSGIFKWLMILGLLYGLWYLYSNGKFDTIFAKGEMKETVLEDHQALESNSTQAEANSVVVDSTSKKDTVTIDTSKKESVIAPQKIVEASPTIESVDLNEPSTTVIEEKTEVKKKTIVEATATTQTMENPETTASVEADDEEKAQIIYNVTVNPTRGMLWYGFINIDTKEKKEFMTKESTPFELHNGKWILVTGHGFLEIVSDLSTVKVTKKVRNKHYFYVDSSEVREIDRKEFRSLNGGRGW